MTENFPTGILSLTSETLKIMCRQFLLTASSAILIGGCQPCVENSSEHRTTKAFLKEIGQALQDYYDDCSCYPQYAPNRSQQPNSSFVTVLAPNVTREISPAFIAYIDSSHDSISKDRTFIDGWGREFIIHVDHDLDGAISIGSDTIEEGFVIYSFGPNGKDDHGMGDDICSWK